MRDTERISETLSQISEALNAFTKQDDDDGLLSGYCGSALFYAYYYRLTGTRKYLNSLNQIIKKMIKALAKKKINLFAL